MNLTNLVIIGLIFFATASALDNGLARTPPMGWLTWQRFRCNVDCKNDPENCISENLIKAQAHEMVSKGFLKLGYEYIIIDDCWPEKERDEHGKLQPDKERFPSGIKALADYVHGLGLKFGIYEDYGNKTCAGYPGLIGHMETDANTFAEWGVDYVKIDGCNSDPMDMPQGYPEFGMYLNKTGRPMVYSCEWPLYWHDKLPDYAAIAKTCNLWRNYDDVQDSFDSVLSIIDHYGDNQNDFAKYAGPGGWNDPDMLIIGDFSLSIDQAQTQMALWAMFASPLIMSNDLRTIRPEFVEILQNRHVIAVNQDPLGMQGRRVVHDTTNNIGVFLRLLHGESVAMAIMYHGSAGTPYDMNLKLSDLGFKGNATLEAMDLFSMENLGEIHIDQSVKYRINVSGVRLIRFTLKKDENKDLTLPSIFSFP